MQLSGKEQGKTRVAGSLFAATAALLGGTAGPSLAQEADRPWRFGASLSFYGEAERVKDGSFNAQVSRGFSRGTLSLHLAVDALTGASASGAVPSLKPQTFTSPSGNDSYRIYPRDKALDPTFHDTRVAGSLDWLQPVGTRGEADLGLSVSSEYDYLHLGGNGRYSLSFNERNTTASLGVALSRDTLRPVGGAPVPLAAMLPAVPRGRGEDDDGPSQPNKRGHESKTIVDLLAGVTQVLGRRTVAELNYSFSRSSGYLTDPYKVISVVDAETWDLVPSAGLPGTYLFERRPDSRTKHSIYAMVKHRLGKPVVDVSYRFMTDDWGVVSHTVDFHWRQPISEEWYLQPHLRFYTQSAADFYRPYLLGGQPLPERVSADYRLGGLDAFTGGVKLGLPLGAREISLRIEYYRQQGRGPAGADFGLLSGLDLFPTLSALIGQVEYRF